MRANEAAWQHGDIGTRVLAQALREGGYVYMLDIADRFAGHRGTGHLDRVERGRQRPAAEPGIFQALGHRLGDRALDAVDRLADAAELGEIVDPPDERHDDEDDDQQRRGKQDHATLLAVEAGRERYDADQAEQERAEEGAKRVLGGRVLDQQLRGTRRGVGGRCPVGGHHHGEREGRHRQHAGGEDREDAVDGVRPDDV